MPTKTVSVLREALWARVPFMADIGYFRYRAGRFLKAPDPRAQDFPLNFPINEQITKEDVVLEVGANIGGNTRALARYGKHVYSFEPSPRGFKWLKRNVRDLPNVTCFNMAISDETGKAEFNHQVASGSLFKNDAINYSYSITVDVRGINDLPFAFNTMVCDAEGAEVPIFRAFDLWGNVEKIYCETHMIEGKSTKPVVRQLLSEHYSYVVEDFDPGLYPWIIAKSPRR